MKYLHVSREALQYVTESSTRRLSDKSGKKFMQNFNKQTKKVSANKLSLYIIRLINNDFGRVFTKSSPDDIKRTENIVFPTKH